ncbi:MAG TPA: MarC family protein [Gammaproteobacteria bacterium]|nr:MarC family protein [Gammaproteobacteria bacterium]
MTTPELIQFIVAMIIMMNPLGSLSIFLDLMRKAAIVEQRKTAVEATFAMTIIMLLTLWGGREILSLLGITIPAFRFAGGIILLLMGFSMLQSKESPVSHTSEDDVAAKQRQSIGIVPIALPLIIGPGTMSTLIITAGDFPQLINKFWMSVICILLALGMGLMLYFASNIAKTVGASVIKVVTRIMGMIIMAIAIGMLAEGLIGLLPILS